MDLTESTFVPPLSRSSVLAANRANAPSSHRKYSDHSYKKKLGGFMFALLNQQAISLAHTQTGQWITRVPFLSHSLTLVYRATLLLYPEPNSSRGVSDDVQYQSNI
jgi:hypothetical protein